MQTTERKPQRKFRINRKKLFSALLSLCLIGVFIAVAAFAVSKAGIVAAGAQFSTAPSNGVPASQSSVSSSETAGIQSSEALSNLSVVVDAGHGGFDPGCIGVSGVHEADINLAIALKLRDELENRGFHVVMTREEDIGLGSTQIESLQERGRIIRDSNADLVISIHMNSFPDDPDVSGPLALFMPGSEKGQMLAELIQRQLNKALDSDGEARSENLSVLRNGSQPSVLVECGFLSNEEEEKNLQQETYQQTVVNAICDGIAAFFAQ